MSHGSTTIDGLTEYEREVAFLALGWSEQEAERFARLGFPIGPPPKKAVKVEPQTKEVEKPKSKPKIRVDRANNDRRMRDAILGAVKANGWTGRGVRQLAEDAGMPRRTARDVIKRIEADRQIEVQPWQRGGARGRDGIRVLREHPCWSDPKHAHALAQSKLSALVAV